MDDDFSFHPALAAQRLRPAHKQIVSIMGRAKRPVTQVEVLTKINSILTDNNRQISQPTLSRLMSDLIAYNILEKQGTTKSATFSVINGADHFLKAPHLRPQARFDINRILNYKPNETAWLTGGSRERMLDAVEIAKQRHVHGVAASRRAAERFLIDLSWASSAMEGSTYEYLDTVALINYGQKADGHSAEEGTLILNHKRAIAYMMEWLGEKKPLTYEFMCRLHALLMRDLITAPELGTVRQKEVRITGSSYIPSGDPRVIKASQEAIIERTNQIDDPCEAAIFLLNSISYVQGMTDGNKRLARLLSNFPLLNAGYPPLSFIDVDKTAYLTGLIAFYELEDLRLINSTVASAYETHAAAYEAAIITPTVTRTVELRERRRIDNCISILANEIAQSSWSDELINSTVVANFIDLPVEEQEIIIKAIRDTLCMIDPINSCAWDILPETAEKIVSVRHLHESASKPPTMSIK